ncbi:MAG TPA: trypsin-like peptidase domain-containing protein [Steroidobacteraceae bacterium]|nr:trypsin-like peptidase domain-containing protein [Steroidobacteraceae bacterium]
MNLRKLGLGVVFLTGAIIGGLALAFLLVVFRPELLLHPQKAGTAAIDESNPAPAPPLTTVATPGGNPPVASEAGTDGASARSFAAAVRRAAPAVVNIYTARVVTERIQPSSLEQLFGEYGPRYQQHVQRALGSGVIVDDGGHIITNNHVIADATSIKVQLADGRSAEARVVGRDPDTDLALLSIKLGKLPVMALGRSDRLQVGDEVLAIGNPLGLQQTVTHGIVSATDRKELGVATFENFIQTDAAINEGNSGGALIDANGELVGINTAVVAKNLDATGVEGIGFAIPVNLARGVMREILDHGHVVRGWSGIVAQDFTDDQAAYFQLARGGIVVTQLYVNSPAVSAGVRVGDIVLAIDGHVVQRAQEALALLATHKPGGSVTLHLQRGTAQLDLDCAVRERPSQL